MTSLPAPSGQLVPEDVVEGPQRRLVRHETNYTYSGKADPRAPGGMAEIYRDLVADRHRLELVVSDVEEAMRRGRNCLVLTQWKAHVEAFAKALADHEPVVLVGGDGRQGSRRGNGADQPGWA